MPTILEIFEFPISNLVLFYILQFFRVCIHHEIFWEHIFNRPVEINVSMPERKKGDTELLNVGEKDPFNQISFDYTIITFSLLLTVAYRSLSSKFVLTEDQMIISYWFIFSSFILMLFSLVVIRNKSIRVSVLFTNIFFSNTLFCVFAFCNISWASVGLQHLVFELPVFLAIGNGLLWFVGGLAWWIRYAIRK